MPGKTNIAKVVSAESILLDPIVGQIEYNIEIDSYNVVYAAEFPQLAVCRDTGFYDVVKVQFKAERDGIGDACSDQIFRRGDANRDGKINVADAILFFIISSKMALA